ncbi:MAG: LamG domain-containing protein, partial [Planctomycetes bacterium]|nr:LamG domain-containing protein [Planctomycetota bacterium]
MCRKLFYLISCVWVLALATSASADLVAHWTFDEGSGTVAADSSGNGYDAVFFGAPVWAEGVYDGALQFGDLDYVEATGYVGITGSDPRTITAWMKTSTTGQQNLITWGENIATQKWRIRIEATNNSLRVENNGGNHWGTTNISDGEWHHIAVTFEDDGTPDIRDCLLYVDGQLEGTAGGGNQAVNTSAGGIVRIGKQPWNTNSFDGSIDDVRIYNHALSADEILGSMVKFSSGIASTPIPGDGALDIPRAVVLRWASSEFAATHNVYFGNSLADVNDAVIADAVSAGQTDNTYDPGRLAFDQTYYWRVDEVNSAPDLTVFKGDIWSFEVEPFSIPISNITATASSEFGESLAEKTSDGSGLVDGLHGTSAGDMWISTGIPASMEWAFDRAYKLHEMWVWNSNQLIETFIGFGAK